MLQRLVRRVLTLSLDCANFPVEILHSREGGRRDEMRWVPAATLALVVSVLSALSLGREPKWGGRGERTSEREGVLRKGGKNVSHVNVNAA